MAKTTKYGATNSKANLTLADYWHASHTFVDGFYRLAPKHKFLYHVSFTINSAVAGGFVEKHGNEIGLLAKRADLPKFDIDTSVVQQYNRKKVIHSRLDYSPVSITFHDDNEGVSTRLWQAYYEYYFADSQSLYPSNNVYKPLGPKKYGLDNGSDDPFFTRISISEIARHTHHTTHLIMPKITAWQHDTLDAYASSETVESTMQIQYETVKYETGNIVEGESPKGFATPEHYDQEKSFIGLNSSSPNEVGSTVNNLPEKFDSVLFTKHDSNYSTTNEESVIAYQQTKDPTLEGLRPNGLELTFSEENSKDNIGINGVFFASPQQKKPSTVASQKQSSDRLYDSNFLLGKLNQNSSLKQSVVEQYYFLETRNSNFKSLSSNAKNFYINEFLDNIRNNNPKSISIASKAVNTL